jgi:hypothetical protein
MRTGAASTASPSAEREPSADQRTRRTAQMRAGQERQLHVVHSKVRNATKKGLPGETLQLVDRSYREDPFRFSRRGASSMRGATRGASRSPSHPRPAGSGRRRRRTLASPRKPSPRPRAAVKASRPVRTPRTSCGVPVRTRSGRSRSRDVFGRRPLRSQRDRLLAGAQLDRDRWAIGQVADARPSRPATRRRSLRAFLT